MKASKIKTYYRRNLPHIQPIGHSFFVTFRLHGTLPKEVMFALRKEYDAQKKAIHANCSPDKEALLIGERKRFFARYDHLLDTMTDGPKFLANPKIAEIVANEIHRFDGEFYDLSAYCIMSNHVHLLIDTSIQMPDDFDFLKFESLDFEPLDYILFRIKGASARYANLELGRTGKKFWQRESYDHYVRNEWEFGRIVEYILNNPVKAGIVENWEEYPYSFRNRHL